MRNFVLSYYSDLIFPSSAAATRQVVKTVDALQTLGADARLYIPIPWKYYKMGSTARLHQLRRYYGLSDQFQVNEIISPLPMIGKIQRFPITYRLLPHIDKTDGTVLCIRNYWHLKLALHRGMTVLYETYKYKSQPKRRCSITDLLNTREQFLGIVMHSQIATDYWASEGARPEKITTIHNGIDQNEIVDPATIDRSRLRQELNLPKTRQIVSYVGNMGSKKGIGSIVEVASHLPNVLFLLVGFSKKKDKSQLIALANKLGADNIEIRPWVPPARVAPYLRASDALIIPPTSQPLFATGDTVLPIKTFVYMASGVPLLAPRLPDTAEILHHKKNAFLLQPDTPISNAQSIRQLLDQPQLREQIAINALACANKFTWNERAEKIVDFVQRQLLSNSETKKVTVP